MKLLGINRWNLLACALLAIPLIVVNFKGDLLPMPVDSASAAYPNGVIQYRHGWPWPYVWRTLPDYPATSPWLIGDGDQVIEPSAAVVNIASAAALLLLMGWAIRPLSNRRFHYRLHGLLLIVALLSIAFAWRHHQQLAESTEREIQSQLDASGEGQIVFNVRPVWLRILLPSAWLEWLEPGLPHRAEGLSISYMGSGGLAGIGNLHDLAICDIEAYGLTESARNDLRGAIAQLASLEHLKCGVLQDADIAAMSSRNTLMSLDIAGGKAFTDGGVDALGAFPRLHDLSIGTANVSWNAIKELQIRRPDLRIQLVWNEY